MLEAIMAALALAGTGANIFSQFSTQTPEKRLAKLSREDIPSSYKPMTEAERAAYIRQIQAEMASRGLPMDSSYATAMAAELLGKTESQRLFKSREQDMLDREMRIKALSHLVGDGGGGGGGMLGPLSSFLQMMKLGKPEPTDAQTGIQESFAAY